MYDCFVGFTCALQKEIVYQGKLFISENWICFHSKVFGKDTKVSKVLVLQELGFKKVMLNSNLIWIGMMQLLEKQYHLCHNTVHLIQSNLYLSMNVKIDYADFV